MRPHGSPVMTPAEALRDVPLPRHEAERLLAAAMGLSRSAALASLNVPHDACDRFAAMVRRRSSGEPLQYIEGSVPFGPIEVMVDRRVLIPRPETEYLYKLVSRLEPPPATVVDLCTGSGCLGLALAATYSESEVHCGDISTDALDVARANATRLDLDVALHRGDLFAALPDELQRRVDLLVANPPYVSTADLVALDPVVRDHEPHVALIAGDDGLSILRRLAAELDRWLAPGGSFAIEIGHDQGAAVASLFARHDGRVVADQYGHPRYVVSGDLQI